MAGVDPYALCPCGSGQKFKWCCQKMEAYADRAQRLYETGQVEGALGVLDEGLKKEPANAWLLIRKALIQVRAQKAEAAKATLRELLKRQPGHVGAYSLLIRCLLETEGPRPAIDAIQEGLAAVSEGSRPGLASILAITGTLMARVGHYPSAMALVGLARHLTAEEGDERSSRVEESILANPAILPWLKYPYELAPAPEGLDGGRAKDFAAALALADSGLWASAASAFDLLTGSVPGPAADRNAGLCRLWMSDDAGAVDALRRAVRTMGETPEAVDLEALCQIAAPPSPDDRVERIQLIWPIRDRDALLSTLRAEGDVSELGRGPIDPDDPDSPEVDQFVLLDRPALPKGSGQGLSAGEIPRIVARVSVGREIAGLERDDDASLDAVTRRFTALAGSAVVPAHPKTKVLGSAPRDAVALSFEWLPPEGIAEGELARLTDAEQSRQILELWPDTPMPYLGGKSPRASAGSAGSSVPLRAALCRYEWSTEPGGNPLDTSGLRRSLGLGPEPEVDPETVDLGGLHYARYAQVPVDRLDDERLITFFVLARELALAAPIARAARAIADRPSLVESGEIAALTVYSELANAAVGRHDLDEAFRLVEQGRRAEPASDRARNAVRWDMLEVMLRTRAQGPEEWVPELAVVMERHRDPESSQTLLSSLVEMGLVRVSPNPDKPGDLLLDPRPLQAMLAEYGPRVTTASGQLGVSATRGGIWTPGSEAGAAPGAIWTPGSSAPPPPGPKGAGPDKPRLIVPGR